MGDRTVQAKHVTSRFVEGVVLLCLFVFFGSSGREGTTSCLGGIRCLFNARESPPFIQSSGSSACLPPLAHWVLCFFRSLSRDGSATEDTPSFCSKDEAID